MTEPHKLCASTGTGYLSALGAKARAAGVPLSASIEFTERCNLHCKHCYLGEQDVIRTRRGHELTSARWCGILDEVAELGALYLLITGGDPLLRKDFAEVYRHAKRRGFLVTVFTNGTLVTDEILELFREMPPYRIEASVYGITQHTYEGVTGIPGSFRAFMNGIDRLSTLDTEFCLKTVLMQTNRAEFDDILRFCAERGNVTPRYDVCVRPGFDGNARVGGVQISPLEAIEIEFSDPVRAGRWAHFGEIRLPLKPKHRDRLYSCGAGRQGFHVNPYGKVQPCISLRHIGEVCDDIGVHGALERVCSVLEGKRLPPMSPCLDCEKRMLCTSCAAIAMYEHGGETRFSSACEMTSLRYARIVSSGSNDHD